MINPFVLRGKGIDFKNELEADFYSRSQSSTDSLTSAESVRESKLSPLLILTACCELDKLDAAEALGNLKRLYCSDDAKGHLDPRHVREGRNSKSCGSCGGQSAKVEISDEQIFRCKNQPIKMPKKPKISSKVSPKRQNKCLNRSCHIVPTFGFKGENRQYCSKHKIEGMVNLRGKRSNKAFLKKPLNQNERDNASSTDRKTGKRTVRPRYLSSEWEIDAGTNVHKNRKRTSSGERGSANGKMKLSGQSQESIIQIDLVDILLRLKKQG